MSTHAFSKLSGPGASMPTSLFGYDVIDLIGEGAGSRIYAVNDPRTGQLYALKHVVRQTDKDIRFIEQLEGEFAVSRQFHHPGLRRAIDMQQTRTLLRRVTQAALVMELFDGVPLDVKPPTGLRAICGIFLQTAQALEALHHLGYVHCDLKPNNILVNAAGDVKVIDFGQTCKAGTVKERIQGTPDYIAPEQVKCEPVTVRTDIFNFGATLYWALSGQKIPTLFTVKREENSFLLDQKVPTPHELNAGIPENLSNLAMECVRTNPAKRPESMSDVVRRLEIAQHGIRHHAAAAANSSRTPSASGTTR
jgi:serine/threonine protein kinase